MIRRYRHVWLAVLLALTLLAPPLAAQDASSTFEDGLAKWEAGDFGAALPLFEEALTASGSPNARFYVARCLRDLGRLAEAYEQMRRTVDDARALAESQDRYAPTRDAAASELAMLEPRVGKLVIALDASLASASVTLNGQPLGSERIGVPFAVLPGQQTVVARMASGDVTQSAAVAPGETKTITLSTSTAAPATVQPTAPEPAVAPDDDSDDGPGFGTLRFIGIGVAAIGVGGIVMFAVGNSIASDKFAELEERCGGPCPDDSFQSIVDEGKSAETMAAVGLGVGIAGLAAGALLLILGGPADADADVALSPHPGGAGLRLRF